MKVARRSMSTPRSRARASARRELDDLVRNSPDVERAKWISSRHAIVHVDLPYLSLGASAMDEPETRRGFRLGVQLAKNFPTEPPTVIFLADTPPFHPAISAVLGAFCLGNAAWTPELGVGRFIMLHVKTVVGAVDVDTLDGLFGDPICRNAAVHYRTLRESGALPLALPRVALRPSEKASNARDRDPSAEPPRGAREAVTVRGPRGRRSAWLVSSPDTHNVSVFYPLSGPGWSERLTPAGHEAIAWLGRRIDSDTDLRLDAVDGAPVLIAEFASGAASEAIVRSVFEPVIRHLEIPILALSDDSVAGAVMEALNHPKKENQP